MQNILFVLYHDFNANSAVHVHHFAKALVAQGLDCVVAVPQNKESVPVLGEPPTYRITEFAELNQVHTLFANGQSPDIVHAWTPREVVRICCEQLSERYLFKLIIHLEDNEECLLEKFTQKSYATLCKEYSEPDAPIFPPHLSHPIQYHQFLNQAAGVTVIMDRLQEFVPDRTPSHVLFPGADLENFSPRPPDPQLAAQYHVPLNSKVLCYTGNVHPANAHEVRSLYLATAMLNREGCPTVLLRTGQDACNFLGDDDRWAKQYVIELGFVERHQLPGILSLADVLIQPGRSDFFNDYRFPSKLPEFLAMGKPVILPAANVGLQMKHRYHALVLPVVDALHIVEAVQTILQDKNLAETLSQGSLEFAKSYLSWSKNSEYLKSFYKKIYACEPDRDG
jgi:glycosyltransferase involved in cell wall biosynthesis